MPLSAELQVVSMASSWSLLLDWREWILYMQMFTQVAVNVIVAKWITFVQVITWTTASSTLFFTKTFFTSRCYFGNGVSQRVVSWLARYIPLCIKYFLWIKHCFPLLLPLLSLLYLCWLFQVKWTFLFYAHLLFLPQLCLVASCDALTHSQRMNCAQLWAGVQQYINSSIDFPIEVNCFKLIVETNYENTDVKGHTYVCM